MASPRSVTRTSTFFAFRIAAASNLRGSTCTVAGSDSQSARAVRAASMTWSQAGWTRSIVASYDANLAARSRTWTTFEAQRFMAAKRPAIIFDFGNVLAFFDYGRAGDILGRPLGLQGGAFF